MYNSVQLSTRQLLQIPVDAAQWFAVMTRPRHEKKVAESLAKSSIMAFLPLVREIHRWSDRRKVLELPLFQGYVFVRLTPTSENKAAVLRHHGVLRLVGHSGYGTPIPDTDIDSIRAILATDLSICQAAFLKVGQRVRVRGGALDGVEGILAECGRRLVVSIDAIQRSLSVTLEGIDVEPA